MAGIVKWFFGESEETEKAAPEKEVAEKEVAEKEVAEKDHNDADETAHREAEEKAHREAEEKAHREAEEKAHREAEEKAHRDAEAEEKARLEAEEKAHRDAEEKARLDAEEKARLEAEQKARLEAEAEEKARLEAEQKARLEAEAEQKARLEAEEKARLAAEEKARLEAEEKARLEAEEKARLEAEEKARALLAAPSSPHSQIQRYLDETKQLCQIVLRESTRRNIIFVGKSRSGKSTVLNGLIDPYRFCTVSTIFAQTKDPQITHFTLETAGSTTENLKSYSIGFIDTPGLYEIRADGESRDIKTLEKLILQCMEQEIRQIHAIFFVLPYSNSLNPQDVESLYRFARFFAGADAHLYILVTKCENVTEEDKSRIKEELMNHPKFQEFFRFTNKSILFFGALSPDLYDTGSLELAKVQMARILEMRLALFDTIFQSDNPFRIDLLAHCHSIRGKAIGLFERLSEQYNANPDIKSHPDFQRELKDLSRKLPSLPGSWRQTVCEFLDTCNK